MQALAAARDMGLGGSSLIGALFARESAISLPGMFTLLGIRCIVIFADAFPKFVLSSSVSSDLLLRD